MIETMNTMIVHNILELKISFGKWITFNKESLNTKRSVAETNVKRPFKNRITYMVEAPYQPNAFPLKMHIQTYTTIIYNNRLIIIGGLSKKFRLIPMENANNFKAVYPEYIICSPIIIKIIMDWVSSFFTFLFCFNLSSPFFIG